MDSVSHIIRFQFLKEHRNSVRIDDDSENGDIHALPTTEDLSIISTLMCEYMIAASQFVQFGYDYYKYVCGTDTTASSAEEKSCLIPVCSFQPNDNMPNHRLGEKRSFSNESGSNGSNNNIERNTLNFSDDCHLLRRNDKRLKMETSSNSSVTDDNEYDDEEGRALGLDSYCVQGVDDALQILSKAADCLRHTVELWQWAIGKLSQKTIIDHLGGWEQGKIYCARVVLYVYTKST